MPAGSTAGQMQVGQSHYDYNFTALPIGSFPANTSWIGFSRSGTNAYSSFAVEPSLPAAGMNVSVETTSSQPPEYFNMTVNATGNTSLKLTFSWNDNFNVVSTEDNFILWQGNRELIHYSLGPSDGGYQYIRGKNTDKIGSDPSQSSYYTAEFSWNTQDPGIGFFSIERGYNATGNFPYTVQLNSSINGGPVTLAVGGYESNITIYSISISGTNSGFTGAAADRLLYYTIDSGNLTRNLGIVMNPFLSIADNDIFFMEKGPSSSIGYWNYENNTITLDPAMPAMDNARYLPFYNSTSYGIIELNQSSSCVEMVNLSSLSVHQIRAGKIPYDSIAAFSTGMDVIVLSNSSLIAINLTSGVTGSVYSGTSSVRIVEAKLTGNSVVGILMNSSSGYFSHFNYSSEHGFNITTLGIYPATGLSVTENFVGYESMQSILTNTLSSGVSFFLNYSGRVMVTQSYSWNQSSPVPYAASQSRLIYLMGNGTIITNLPDENVTGLWMSQNQSSGALVANGTIYLFFTGREPLSPYGISVSLSEVPVETANFSVPYEVQSSLEYSLSAYLNGTPVTASGGDIEISVRGLAPGAYYLCIEATNSAGYKQASSEYVEIDTFHPTVSVTPGNGSYVSLNQTFEFSISNVSAGGNSNLTAGGSWEVFNTNSFSFQLSGIIGNFTMRLNYSDPMGILHTYRFEFDAISTGLTPGTVSISNGSFLPSETFTLSWPHVNNASSYIVLLQTENSSKTYESDSNSTILTAGNGNHTVTIVANLLDGRNITVAERHFSVESYAPKLAVSFPTGNFLSFYTDSPNNTLEISADTNVSAIISVSILFDGSFLREWTFAGTLANLNLERSSGLFHRNGTYTVYISATGKSGLSSDIAHVFSVNNSIPSMELFPKGNLYLNETSVQLSAGFVENLSYSYSATWNNGTESGNISGSTIRLPLQNTTYMLSIRGINRWGTFEYSNSTVYSYEVKPEITIIPLNHVLTATDILNISYEIMDPLNVSVSLEFANGTDAFHSELSHSSAEITFSSDGNYNLTLIAKDRAGNFNTSRISNISVEYFPEVTSLGIGSSMFMGFGYLYPLEKGKYLQNIQFSWKIDGKYHLGSGIHVFLMPGFHHIRLYGRFQGQEYMANETIFVVGFIPEALAIGTLTSALLVYRYTFRYDETAAEAIIFGMKDSSLRSIMKEIRRKRIRKSAARKTIAKLLKTGSVRIMKDPDGKEYVMQTKRKA